MAVFSVSLSGIRAAFARLDVHANNIANVATPGFKSSRLIQVDAAPGGTAVGGVSVDVRAGPIEIDGGPISMAVLGEGMFQVQTPQGPRFTSAGVFKVDSEGYLVDPSGHRLSPNVQVPADARAVMVSATGVVSALKPDNTVVPVGQVQLVRFSNRHGLKAEGDNLFSATAASGDPVTGLPGEGGFGRLLFGGVEGSNVDLSAEMVGTLLAKASARLNLVALRAQDDVLGDLLDLTA